MTVNINKQIVQCWLRIKAAFDFHFQLCTTPDKSLVVLHISSTDVNSLTEQEEEEDFA